ncbi:hypothetical protein LWI29_035271 [Acer saccharum]|uniref:Epidermal patterning factor-like protein n=1 Tax=Acer saccharum TaxID=4024 RepID=A0AA39RSC1_ACESA|nr:hypothetical protein LWI29_035271 [Acer saccharum]
MGEEVGMEVYPTGSSLPDCSHACGPCFPCKRVMVSFKCSIAESCPIVYRCMCKGKYYHTTIFEPLCVFNRDFQGKPFELYLFRFRSSSSLNTFMQEFE